MKKKKDNRKNLFVQFFRFIALNFKILGLTRHH